MDWLYALLVGLSPLISFISLLLAVLALLRPEESRDFVVNTLSRMGIGRGRLTGRWVAKFSIHTGEFQALWVEEIHVRQSGSHVVGYVYRRWSSKDFDKSYRNGRIRIRAKKIGPYITGTWWNAAEGDETHGAFQLQSVPKNDSMIGWWIGYQSSEWRVPRGNGLGFGVSAPATAVQRAAQAGGELIEESLVAEDIEARVVFIDGGQWVWEKIDSSLARDIVSGPKHRPPE